jgi:predicted CoA-binding protein
MPQLPAPVTEFLAQKRLAVAGVSRDRNQAANAVYRKLRAIGREVVPINPRAAEVEGARCYPDLGSVPGAIDGLVVATPPAAAVDLVRQCVERGVGRVWFHRSFGAGSVSEEAVRECRTRGLASIVGGCPLMYCEPVDPGHRCMRWWLRRRGRVPG